ncbi:benzoate 1,2-dioxygenase small subunit [Pluralibacter gergoviae]|uniref:Benzene 1,2-dioxygenase n=1 Tax=Pluralibacter gergoviae TaxID=61647 RepID=A0A089PN61_PLUGE|nr:benzoate 1,2-dioxygenase small subunit [Pluralibacter gergoviae]AIR01338.1 benzoate 1,2-dioxygenase small subunit [Pluralibacter gergoviae]AVR04381.1 benzoate 1,2-dioxygenase small subunit [Pluralibacter gergoviae]EKT9642076.1 benzoate 1,2-dioxygenase small subunit [Pluralibacter gergoviae]EKT9643699.1 benzoate 1,2-dioxygenase small subunit [Pluralibacter gergoviae]EKV3544779.1 benzoate 1,2-dioxygenase small subunit [Pluralibacter gergoviae]
MLNLETVRQFLYYEARLLDDRQWDEWLTCYSPDVVFWMPAWSDDDRLTTDPQRELSLIYYPNREGLEDRVYRIKTERSGASTPEPRTTHIISNVELLGENAQGVEVRYSWVTYNYRYQHTDAYFGSTICTLAEHNDKPQIVRKTVRLNNDYIRQVIDVYHI